MLNHTKEALDSSYNLYALITFIERDNYKYAKLRPYQTKEYLKVMKCTLRQVILSGHMDFKSRSINVHRALGALFFVKLDRTAL